MNTTTAMASFIDGRNIAATLHMVRRTQIIRKPIVLTEGDKDKRVLTSVLRSVAEVVAGSGKAETIDAINYIPESDANQWLTIVVDADFDRLRSVSYPVAVLSTDCHDMDCEHIRSYALVKFIKEYCSQKKCLQAFHIDISNHPEAVADAIRAKLLSLAMPIGSLRLLSIAEDIKLSFKNIDHKKLLQASRLEVDRDSLYSVILANSRNVKMSLSEIKRKHQDIESETHDPWQLCQGHDLCQILVHSIRKYWGIGDVKVDELERAMRLAYESEYFWQTELGKSIKTRIGQQLEG